MSRSARPYPKRSGLDLNGQPFTSFCTPGVYYFAARLGGHSTSKSVSSLAFNYTRLIRSFHESRSDTTEGRDSSEGNLKVSIYKIYIKIVVVVVWCLRRLCITCCDTDAITRPAATKDVDKRCFWRARAGDKNGPQSYPQLVRKAVHKLLTSTPRNW